MHSSDDERRRQLMSQFTAVRFAPIEPFHPVTTPSNSNLPTVYLEDCKSRCDICLADFAPPEDAEEGAASEKLSQLPCSHIFHTNCIAKWILPGDSESDDSSILEPTLNHRCPSCRSNLWPNCTSDQRSPVINTPIVAPPLFTVLRSLRSARSFERPRNPESSITAPTPHAETMLQPERHLPGGSGQLEALQQPRESPEGCTFLPFRSRERICPNLGRVLKRLWK